MAPSLRQAAKIMNFTASTRQDDQTLRLKMDSRTLAEQECEIRYIRRRLEKLAAARTGNAVKPAPVVMSSTQPSLAA